MRCATDGCTSRSAMAVLKAEHNASVKQAVPPLLLSKTTIAHSRITSERVWYRLEEENFSFDRYTFSSWLQDSTDLLLSLSRLAGSERRPIS
ncbi:hypothetical protein J6590_068671 [Homalodisca vitripennis]|nr:hypothetical protein J6590_068671 [Homalodisca vitripennis]